MRTFKKVINHIIVSSALLTNDILAIGVDSVALGQTSITDGQVPTGTKIRGFLISFGVGNVGTSNMEVGICLEYLVSGQTLGNSPLSVGGNPQRNQVIRQWHANVAQDTNFNRTEYVKIPKQFQRMREGMIWRLNMESSESRTMSSQTIYKCRL